MSIDIQKVADETGELPTFVGRGASAPVKEEQVKPDYQPSVSNIPRVGNMKIEDRVLWFRHDYPHGKITQEAVQITDQLAVFRTRVEDGEGGVAESYGSETLADFRDYIEKGATKSLGRALSVLGYGTAGALQEGEVADSPSQPLDLGSQGRNRQAAQPSNRGGTNFQQQETSARAPYNTAAAGGDMTGMVASEKQVKFIYALGKQVGLDEADLVDWATELYRVSDLNKITRRDAANFIDRLQARKAERE